MSKRYVPRGADPAADAESAALAWLADATSRRNKRALSGLPVITPSVPPKRALPVRPAWRHTSGRTQTLRDAARLYAAPVNPPDGTA
jgi:hypothetical protein